MENTAFLLELGGVVVGLAVLARLAGRLGLPTIPLYLTAGLAFGEGGIVPLVTTEGFVEVGAEIGLILLLFMLGLEYTAAELLATLRLQALTAGLDVALNFLPGVIAGVLLGWSPVASIALGGVTYVSSSGIIAKVLQDLRRVGNRETPVILSVLVIEDLVMAVYLPILGGLLIGTGTIASLGTAAVSITGVLVLLLLALRLQARLSKLLFSRSDEVLLLSILGITLLIAGAAEHFRISAAVGALLVGIMLSGPAAEGARALLSPLRDLFDAMFFAFVGFNVDPSLIPPVLGTAVVLGIVTAATKFLTGWWSARRNGIGPKGRIRSGTTLIARGEFSIAVAGVVVAADIEPGFGALAVAYVFLLAVVGPIAARVSDPFADRFITAR